MTSHPWYARQVRGSPGGLLERDGLDAPLAGPLHVLHVHHPPVPRRLPKVVRLVVEPHGLRVVSLEFAA